MTKPASSTPPQDQRTQAVLALLHGESTAAVSARYGIGRSALYKFRRRALEAVRTALADHPCGAKRPHNHLDDALERKAVTLCQRYPALSSYQIARRVGHDAPSPRTIQRIRKRHHLARVPKRASPSSPSRKLSPRAAAQARALLHEKPYLGPDRLAWDLWNGQGIHVSPSTFKRYKKKWRELMKPVPLPSPTWRFEEFGFVFSEMAHVTGIFLAGEDAAMEDWRERIAPSVQDKTHLEKAPTLIKEILISVGAFSDGAFAPIRLDRKGTWSRLMSLLAVELGLPALNYLPRIGGGPGRPQAAVGYRKTAQVFCKTYNLGSPHQTEICVR